MTLATAQTRALLGLGAKTGKILLLREVFELWSLWRAGGMGTQGQGRPLDSVPQTPSGLWFRSSPRSPSA